MRFARSQKGMSLLGWLVVLGVVAFFASAAFKIIPHYMDYYSLEKVITSVETDKAAEVRSVPEFYSMSARDADQRHPQPGPGEGPGMVPQQTPI